MSKWMLAVCGLVLCLAAVSSAADHYEVYNFGSGAMYGAAPSPYDAPSGMRFGDMPQVGGTAESGYAGCTNCFGVTPHPCDPCWRGPCMDWKLIGWYSHWGDGHHGCHRKNCCASVGNACCATCN
jgi:hypothetical protein